MPSIYDSKYILITGAAFGIGRALALALVKLPSHLKIIAAGRRKEWLEELSKVDGIHNVELDLGGLLQDLVGRFPDVTSSILIRF
ncbi:hypothetical protein CPB84DRAFT_1690059 [Gymnopilus junonius]|uniref:Uncharacterized protein n=1 Tax=Gymnopilus junonius TaxID=109634 RepID=A0A9P5NC01_GYMJU|nr:hypothetical protein CPB84DRAFT_1690059 [Gymnopilus junonius]